MVYKVLIVDDEPQVIEVTRQFLESAGYEVYDAESAETGLEVLNNKVVDVVISDELMPGISGTEFLGIVRRDYPDTIRILLTGHANLEMAINAINVGEIYRFFTKPCSFSDLEATLNQAIKQRELVTESRRLLHAYKQQAAMLKKLEKHHPGVTKIDKTSTGSIIIDDTQEDFDSFVEELKAEVKKAEDKI